MTLIEVRDIVKKYNKYNVVDEVSLSIQRGDVIGIMGANGAGKSTLMGMLVTVIKPTSGDILYNNISIIKQPKAIRGNIGYVPQDIALYQELSGMDNLKFWGTLYHINKTDLNNIIENVIKIIGLDKEILKRKVCTYSGGMKRRLNIGIALLNSPEVIVMDEPTVGIDIISKQEILSVIKRLNKEGKTIVYTTHYFDEIEQICNKICIMKNGKILEFRDVKTIVNDETINNNKLTEFYMQKYQGNHLI